LDVCDPNISLSIGYWTSVEDSKLKDAVQTHGGKDWKKIAALVPGRTKVQCKYRWKDVLDPCIDRANERMGKWAEDEDSKLKDAVQTHGAKNWNEIALLVPGRTKQQCNDRWYRFLDPSIDRANGRTGKWAEDEDRKLKDAVQTHGSNDWDEITALVPGRTKVQCKYRWKATLDPSIDRASERTGKWAEDEDSKLPRTGMQLPCWFRVEHKDSVGADGVMHRILTLTCRMNVRVAG
jgi:hypothetical protein